MSRPYTSVKSNQVAPQPPRPSTSASASAGTAQKLYEGRKAEFISSLSLLLDVLDEDSTDTAHKEVARGAVDGVSNAMHTLLDGAVQQSKGRAAVPDVAKATAATASQIIGGISSNLSSLPYAGSFIAVIATVMSFAADYLVLDDACVDLCLEVVALFELLLPLAYKKKKQEFLDNVSGKVHVFMLKKAVAAEALEKAKNKYCQMVVADKMSPDTKAEVVASYERQEEERTRIAPQRRRRAHHMRPPRVVIAPKRILLGAEQVAETVAAPAAEKDEIKRDVEATPAEKEKEAAQEQEDSEDEESAARLGREAKEQQEREDQEAAVKVKGS
ncbi:hypothetical protein FOA52_006944 [Chlamydomonas sp. UWO 241]|nr:hypothetical protein FOA52_006944 [Chlamydomonas sp. UWO 241]